MRKSIVIVVIMIVSCIYACASVPLKLFSLYFKKDSSYISCSYFAYRDSTPPCDDFHINHIDKLGNITLEAFTMRYPRKWKYWDPPITIDYKTRRGVKAQLSKGYDSLLYDGGVYYPISEEEYNLNTKKFEYNILVLRDYRLMDVYENKCSNGSYYLDAYTMKVKKLPMTIKLKRQDKRLYSAYKKKGRCMTCLGWRRCYNRVGVHCCVEGKIACEKCRTSGKIDGEVCTDCGGEGYIRCEKCAGTGECTVCNGTGYTTEMQKTHRKTGDAFSW